MASLATIIFTTKAGATLTVEPKAGKSGAIGIFMPKDGQDQFFPLTSFDETYAESSDTEGGRRIQSRATNPSGNGAVLVVGDDQTSFHTEHQRWQEFSEAMRVEGGTLKYTPAEGTSVTFELESFHNTSAKYDGTQMLNWMQEFDFEFVAKPFGLLTQEEQTLRDHDPFSRDTIGAGEWAVFDAGTGTLEIKEGNLVPVSTVEKRLYRFGMKQADGTVTIKVTSGASVAGGATLLTQKRLDASNNLYGQLLFSGAVSSIAIRKFDTAAISTLLESGTFTTTANTVYWLQQSITGNKITLSVFTSDPDLVPAPTAIKSITTTLAGADATKFGSGVWGNCGLKLSPQGVDWRWDEWRADAKIFRANSPFFDVELLKVKGHTDALAELSINDLSTQNRRFVDFGLEKGIFYNSTNAPPNLLDSDQLLTIGFSGVQTTRTGAYDPLETSPNCVRATLSNYATVVCGSGLQRHVGLYRLKARVYVGFSAPATAAGGQAFVRYAATSFGTTGQFTRGEWVRVPTLEGWCEVDLGIAEAQFAKTGSQGWEVRIEALSETNGDTIDVDYIMFFGGSRYGKSKAVTQYETPFSVVASDLFNQEPEAALGGKVVGGVVGGEFLSKNPTLAETGAGESKPWSNPSNATGAPDGSSAQVTLGGAGESFASNVLILYKNAFAIPVGATVKGIKVEVRKGVSVLEGGDPVRDASVILGKVKGVGVGENKASAGYWPGGLVTSVYGGESDLWGTTWTPAQINAEGFCFMLSAKHTNIENFGAVANVDAITVTIYFTPEGGFLWKELGAKEPKYIVYPATHNVERKTATTDEANKGRHAWVPGNYSAQVVQAEVSQSTNVGTAGIMTRYKESTGQRVALVLSGSPYKIKLIKWTGTVAAPVASTAYTLNKPIAGWPISKIAGQSVLLRLEVDADGRWLAWADGILLGQGYDPYLAIGEFASGSSGLYDEHSSTNTSKWDNYVQWTPESKGAIWAGRGITFRSYDAMRENIEGGYWSNAIGYEGARLKIPCAGPAGQVSRLSMHVRRANVDENVDEWISDEMQVSLKVTPRVVLLG